MVKILFLGNDTDYSNLVKTALEKAGYPLVTDQKEADLIVSAAYGQKIDGKGLNLHPSLLPAYRGATPVPHQILDGVAESGITIIEMADEIDSGPIVAQEKVGVKPDDTSLDLLNRCFSAGAKLLIKVLPDHLNNKITLLPQPKASPTKYCRRFTKQDGFIDWEEFKHSRSSVQLDRKIRALFPWPGVWTKIPNGKILKLLPKNLVQLEGKQPITFSQFAVGYGSLL
jgi:methionyl-tRNA formyltransferase